MRMQVAHLLGIQTREERLGWGGFRKPTVRGRQGNSPQEPQPGPGDTKPGSSSLLSCPVTTAKHLWETNVGYESEMTSSWQVALGKPHPCPEPRFLHL